MRKEHTRKNGYAKVAETCPHFIRDKHSNVRSKHDLYCDAKTVYLNIQLARRELRFNGEDCLNPQAETHASIKNKRERDNYTLLYI